MPTNRYYTQIPELYEPRQRLKEWLVEKYPICEFSGKRGHDLHEGLIEGNDLKGLHKKSEETQILVWSLVLHHPANVALVNHDHHLQHKPSREAFLTAVLKRPESFFQEYGLKDWTFRNAALAYEHFKAVFETLFEEGVFKVRISLP